MEFQDGLFSILPYFAARYFARLPVTVVLAVVYITPIYWLAGLQNEAESYALFSLLTFVTLLIVQAFALATSSFVTDFKVGGSQLFDACL